jgi:hypothetical protein
LKDIKRIEPEFPFIELVMFLQKRNDPENIYSDIKAKCTGKKNKFCLQIHNFFRDEIFPGEDYKRKEMYPIRGQKTRLEVA